MSTSLAQIQFAAEFVTFLVAAAGLALVALNPETATDRWWTRLALAAGFTAMGVAAFGRGSLLFKPESLALVDRLRVVGIAGLAVGTVRWRAGPPARTVVWLGLAVTTASVAANGAHASRLADGLLAGGSVLIGAALLGASRRSIAARVAASAAGTLLLVVLVLSVALSAVLSSSAQTSELTRLTARARTEARLATDSFVPELQTARYVGEYLEKAAPAALINIGGTAGPSAADSDTVSALLTSLQALYPVGGLAYLLPSGHLVAASGLASGLAPVLAGLDQVQQTACPGPVDRGSAAVVGRQLVAVAAYPECLDVRRIGVVVRISPLDATYLGQRHADDSSVTLAVADRAGPLATFGRGPKPSNLTGVAVAALAKGSSASGVTTGWYVAAEPIQASNRTTIAALVVATPTSSVVSTRDRLFRTLFLIALGGTLLALGLAAIVGDRITAGLRRLTFAAEGVRRGDIGRRAGIAGEDEVGTLGAAFDSMVASVQEGTRALQAAADDETRLRNRLEAVVAGMNDALVAVDRHGRITDFNQAAEALSGVSATSARGRAVEDVLVLVDEEGASLSGRLLALSPARWGGLATLMPAIGGELPVAVSAGSLRGPGNDVVGRVLVLRDLRREHEVERMKSEFLSRVGHELRTPLTGIMGYVDILRRGAVEPEQAHLWHEEIRDAAKRLLRIVEMLEFFASSGAGRVPLYLEPIDVSSLIDGAVTNWSGRLPVNASLSRRVDRSTPDVLGDRRWLALALDELIDNAVKFSPDGGAITVTAALTAMPAAPGADGADNGRVDAVAISVVDEGLGMTPNERATVFGEFFQGDASDTRRFGGLGLGLSMVQRVVADHSGTVTCAAAPTGSGSVFTMTLPAVAKGTAAPTDRSTTIGTAGGQG